MADRTVTVRLAVEDAATRPLTSAKDAAAGLSTSLKDIAARSAMAAAGVESLSAASNRMSLLKARAAESGSAMDALRARSAAASVAIRTGFETATTKATAAAAAAEAVAAKYDAVSRAGTGLMKVGLGVGAAFAVGATRFASFDAEMSKVAAGTGAAGAELERLRSAAETIGDGSLGYGAKDAAQGITELGKAGVSTSAILGGGLKGALALAASGQMQVGDAAETAASAMTQFGLSGKDIPHIADLLSAGAAKAQGSVADMGAALNQAGLVAHSTGLTIDETATALTAFASAGLTGSDAGTSLKTMLQRLTPTSAEAKAKFTELGISAYDASGNFVGLANFSGQLRDSMSGLTPEARNAAMAVMFGSDAVRAANILYEQGEPGIRKWSAAVNDAGHSTRTAATLMDNLNGDVMKLGASFDSVFIKSGSGVNSVLRSITQSATGTLQIIGGLPPATLQLGAGLTGLAAAAALAGGAGISLTTKWLAAKAAMDAAGISTARLSVAMRAVGAIGLAGVFITAAPAITAWISKSQVATIETRRLSAAMTGLSNARATDGLNELMSTTGLFGEKIDNTGRALEVFGNRAKQALGDDFASKWDRFESFGGVVDKFTEQTRQLDSALASMVTSGNAAGAADAMRKLEQAAQAQGVPLDQLREKFTEYNAAVQATSGPTGEQAAALRGQESAAESARAAAAGLTSEQQRLAKSAEDAAKAIKGLSSVLDIEESADRATESLQALGGKIDKTSRGLEGNSAAALKNRAALREVTQAHLDHLEKMAADGASTSEVSAKAEEYARAIERQAGKLGLNSTQVARYTDQLRKVPGSVDTKINVFGLDQAQRDLAALAARLGSMNNRTYESRFVMTYVNRGVAPAGAVRAAAGATGGTISFKPNGLTVAADGAVLPGYTPGRDVHWFTSPTGGVLGLSGGEAVMRPEWTMAVGPDEIHRMNKIAAAAGVSGVKSYLGLATGGVVPPVQAFASGGTYSAGQFAIPVIDMSGISSLWKSTTSAGDSGTAAITQAKSGARKAVAIASKAGQAALDTIKSTAAGNPQVLAFLQTALAQQGDKYVWGAGHSSTVWKQDDPAAFDCSGLVGYALGRTLGQDMGGTAWDIGRRGTQIGVAKAIKTPGALLYHKGHIAISLGDGRTIEAGGRGTGVNIGKATGRNWTGGAWVAELGSPLSISAEAITKAATTVVAQAPGWLSFASATVGRNKATGSFLANIRKINARGYTTLAARLLEMGEEEAGQVAAELAAGAAGNLRTASAGLDANAALQSDRESLKSQLLKSVAPPSWQQAATAKQKASATTKTFLDNLAKIADRGYGPLAMRLLDLGEEEAGPIAADAVKLSTKQLSALKTDLVDTPDAVAKQAKELADRLSGATQPTYLTITPGAGAVGDPRVVYTAPPAIATMPGPYAPISVQPSSTHPRQAPLMHVENVYAESPRQAVSDMTTQLGDALAVSGIGRV